MSNLEHFAVGLGTGYLGTKAELRLKAQQNEADMNMVNEIFRKYGFDQTREEEQLVPNDGSESGEHGTGYGGEGKYSGKFQPGHPGNFGPERPRTASGRPDDSWRFGGGSQMEQFANGGKGGY